MDSATRMNYCHLFSILFACKVKLTRRHAVRTGLVLMTHSTELITTCCFSFLFVPFNKHFWTTIQGTVKDSSMTTISLLLPWKSNGKRSIWTRRKETSTVSLSGFLFPSFSLLPAFSLSLVLSHLYYRFLCFFPDFWFPPHVYNLNSPFWTWARIKTNVLQRSQWDIRIKIIFPLHWIQGQTSCKQGRDANAVWLGWHSRHPCHPNTSSIGMLCTWNLY